MKKMRKLAAIALVLILSVLVLASCSSADSKRAESLNAYDGVDFKEESAAEIADDMTGTTAEKRDPESDLNKRKIIETVRLSVQTKTYDTLMQDLERKIAALGGYVETSQITGREMDSNSRRWAELTVRIPSEKSVDFTEFVSENSVVVSKSVDTEDVTLSYVDMESRVKALEMEKEALEGLLANAASVTEIMNVRQNLTNVIYEIESYKTRLRTYDNLVDYTTVHLNVHEVERVSVVEKQGTWQKIGTNLKNNFQDVWEGFVNAFVFAVSSLPYLIPMGIAILVLWCVFAMIRKGRKRTRKTEKQ
ncbi:MAG: DUF4349 domain-containing protein [Clostridia bacterium]|nr:DUF4349 domain-containing protein [Clostridia bacterium]